MLSTFCIQFCSGSTGYPAAPSSRPHHLYLFSVQTNNTLSASALSLLSYCICPYLHSAEWKTCYFFFILLYQSKHKQQSQLSDNTLPSCSNEDMLNGDTVCSGCKDMVGNNQLMTGCLNIILRLFLSSTCCFPYSLICVCFPKRHSALQW